MKKYFTLILLIILQNSCKEESERDRIYNRITQWTTNDSLTMSKNRGDYMDSLIRECETFITRFPNDSAAPYFLLQTANYQITQQRNRLALIQLDKLIKMYPNTKWIPVALYIKGDIYKEKFNDKEKAKETWIELERKFPESEWAKQVKVLIENLDLSDEDLFKKIMSQNDSQRIN